MDSSNCSIGKGAVADEEVPEIIFGSRERQVADPDAVVGPFGGSGFGFWGLLGLGAFSLGSISLGFPLLCFTQSFLGWRFWRRNINLKLGAVVYLAFLMARVVYFRHGVGFRADLAVNAFVGFEKTERNWREIRDAADFAMHFSALMIFYGGAYGPFARPVPLARLRPDRTPDPPLSPTFHLIHTSLFTMAQEPKDIGPVTETPADAPASAPAKQSVRSFKYDSFSPPIGSLGLIVLQKEICKDESQV